MPDDIVIPDKPAFKASEVCELLKLQSYVLKSWEHEFQDLGVSKTPGGPRVYRRADVERAVRIRQLMLEDGLTLAGVRRRLEQESAGPTDEDVLVAELSVATTRHARSAPVTATTRERVAHVKQGLRDLLDSLSRPAAPAPAAQAPAAPATTTFTSGPDRDAAVRQRDAGRKDRRELTVVPDEASPSLFEADDKSDQPPAEKPARSSRRKTPPGDPARPRED
jgi:DNA-binding transcriptional MerR regulator